MALLQCDICGGKLMAKSGGIFECEYCGMQYDKTRIQEMVQEIKGTVKVEGTVEVTGSVKIDGPVRIEGGVNADNLVKRGQMALEDENWTLARQSFEEALKIDAERGECYWGILCAQYKHSDSEEFLEAEYHRLKTDKDFARAMGFADSKIREKIAVLEQEHAVQTEVHQKQFNSKAFTLGEVRDRIRPAQHLLCCTDNVVVAVKTDGTVRTAIYGYLDSNHKKWSDILCRQLETWENIVAISADHSYVAGLKKDGTVVTASMFESDSDEMLAVSSWRDIVAIDAGFRRILGLKKDGTVVSSGKDYRPNPLTGIIKYDLSDWRGITAISHVSYVDIGMRAGGSVVLSGNLPKNSTEAACVKTWSKLDSVSAAETGSGSAERFVGLCRDGTILHQNGKHSGMDFVAIYSCGSWTYALDKDGNVFKLRWDGTPERYLMGKAIVSITPRRYDLLCLTKDGTLISCDGSRISNDFEDWKLFNSVDTIAQERQQIAEEKIRSEEEERAAAYEKALKILNHGTSVSAVEKAIDIFSQLGDYRDSADNILKCHTKLQEVKNQEVYSHACSLLNTDDSSRVEQAQQKFRELGDWKDSRDKAVQCEEKLTLLRKIAEERKALETKRQKLLDIQKALEEERANLGLFSGKRKKEIDAELQKVCAELMQIEKQKELTHL